MNDAHKRIPPAIFEKMSERLKEQLYIGAIKKFKRPFAIVHVLVETVLVSCKFNIRTVMAAYFLLRIEDTADTLSRSKYDSKLNFPLATGRLVSKKTTNIKRHFWFVQEASPKYKRMSFGLPNAPATFQHLI